MQVMCFVPIETVTVRGTVHKDPRYFVQDDQTPARWQHIPAVRWACMRNGAESFGLVTADVTPENAVLLSEKPDVVMFPDEDSSVFSGPGRGQIVSVLAQMHLPTNWLTGNNAITRLEAEQTIRSQFLFNQRIKFLIKDTLFKGQVRGNTRFQNLDTNVGQAVRQALLDLKFATPQNIEEKVQGQRTLDDIFSDIGVQGRSRRKPQGVIST